MKYLKLYACEEKARMYAEALIGSVCRLISSNGIISDYRVLYGTALGLFVVQKSNENAVMLWPNILVRLDKMEVDPWVMAKYALEGRSYYYGSGDDDPSGPCNGFVDKYDETFVLVGECVTTEVEENKITLDLYPIEAGLYAGVTIVEIDE